MFEIGSSLRQARQLRKLELCDVERDTRIRAKYLAALEDERFHILPGRAYVRGFLRTYAEFLDQDSSLYVEEYNARYRELEEEAPLVHGAAGGLQLELLRPLVVALAALAAASAVVWELGFTNAHHPAAPAARLLPPVTKTVATAPRPVSKPAAHPVVHRAAPYPATFVVRAVRGTCWVSVHVGSPTGPVLFEQVLARGGRLSLHRKLFVRLGAPWNTDVSVRGRRLGRFPHVPVDLTAA